MSPLNPLNDIDNEQLIKSTIQSIKEDYIISDKVAQSLRYNGINKEIADVTGRLYQQFADTVAGDFDLTPKQIFDSIGLNVNNFSPNLAGTTQTGHDAIKQNKIKYIKDKKINLLAGHDAYLSQISNNILTKDKIVKNVSKQERIKTALQEIANGKNEYDESITADEENKLYQSNKNEEIRGFFDFSNLTQQTITILKNGDIDTLLHELGHMFTLNYVKMAIDTNRIYLLKNIMNYYKINSPKELMNNVNIQENLAESFLTYLKTGQSHPRLYTFFNKIKIWLSNMWKILKSKGLVNDEISPEVRDFFDSLFNRKETLPEAETIKNNLEEIKKIIDVKRSGKYVGRIKLKGMSIRELENLVKSGQLKNIDDNLLADILLNLKAIRQNIGDIKDQIDEAKP